MPVQAGRPYGLVVKDVADRRSGTGHHHDPQLTQKLAKLGLQKTE
jgi:hypothetical protein